MNNLSLQEREQDELVDNEQANMNNYYAQLLTPSCNKMKNAHRIVLHYDP